MLTGRKDIEQALSLKIVRNTELEAAQALWRSMLAGEATWNVSVDPPASPSIHIASSICREVSNNSTFELEATLDGIAELQTNFDKAVEQMPEVVNLLAGYGSLVLKPFVRGSRVLVNIATPDRFFPLKYNETGALVSVAFADTFNTAEDFYTLVETHTWDEPTSTYTITYKAFHSKQNTDLGKPIAPQSVPEWSHLQDISFVNISQPLFVEVCLQDKQAIFAKAVKLIRLADEQYGRAVWEFEGGELAVDASIDSFKRDANGNPILPKGKERQFRVHNVAGEFFKMQTFSPELRDTSLFNGLNEHKRHIEFTCGLAYGTISDPQNVDRTATEIRAAKQRFLITIRNVQRIVEEAYRNLAESINILGFLYELYPFTSYELAFVWGDSVLEDPDEEYRRRLELVDKGILTAAEFRAWYMEEDLETAQAALQPQEVRDANSNE